MDKLKFLLLFVLIALMSACSKDEYESRLPQLVIKDLEFSSDNGEQSMSFPGEDFKNYSISANESWCEARLDFDASKIIVKVNTNDAYDDRSCIVTISDIKDELATRSFKVVQKQKDAIIIKGNSFTVPEEGGEVSVEVQSNVSYKVEIPESASWITQSVSTTRGLTSSTIVLKAEKNNSGDERNAEVLIINNKTGDSSKITIRQSLTPWCTLDKNYVELYEDGGIIAVKVNSNVRLYTDYDDYWVESEGREDTQDWSFVQKIKVAPFTEKGEARTTTVTFWNLKWNIYKKVTIVQTNREEPDIESLISADTNSGYTTVIGPSGAFSGYFVSSTLKNGSKRSVTVNKCTIYEGGSLLGTETGFGTMEAGGTKSVSVRNSYIDITSRSYTFVWEYSYNGRTYTYTSNYR